MYAPGPRLVRVDAHVVRLRVLLLRGDELHLAPGCEERAAAASEVGRVELIDHVGRSHPAHTFELGVAADGPILVELRQVALVGAGEDDDGRLLSHRAAPRRSPARPPRTR